MKSKADPVFFISLVSVERHGIIDEHEYIFDLYTKKYDFLGIHVQVISAQDLWNFYEFKKPGAVKTEVDIYLLVEYFIQHHSNGHFIIDECPIIRHSKLRALKQEKMLLKFELSSYFSCNH